MGLIDNGGGGGYLADIAAVLKNNGGGNGNGGSFGGDQNSFLILILVIIAAMCGGGFGNGNGNNSTSDLIPFMMASRVAPTPAVVAESSGGSVQRGFDHQSVMANLDSIGNAISTGFANAEVSRCTSHMNILEALHNDQLGLYTILNNNQNSTTQAMNNLAMGLEKCCCNNQAATADLKYTVATEACADRQAINNGIRDVIANATANTQAIVNSQNQGFQAVQNKLCQLELDEVKRERDDERRENIRLQSELNNARLGESQTAQTAQIIANFTAQLQTLTNMLLPRCGCNNQPACGC